MDRDKKFKKVVFTVLLIISFFASKGQTYISEMTGFYTGLGTIKQRTMMNIEVGKQWDAFSLGINIGKTNIEKSGNADTTTSIEIRPNLNVFQQGKFSNTLTIGLGYIFSASQNVLTEISTGVEYTPSSNFSYNLYFGTYYYSGNYSYSSNNYLGFSVMYYLKNSRNNKFIIPK